MLINLYQNENKFIHLNLVKKLEKFYSHWLQLHAVQFSKKISSYGIQMNKCAFPPIVDLSKKNGNTTIILNTLEPFPNYCKSRTFRLYIKAYLTPLR